MSERPVKRFRSDIVENKLFPENNSNKQTPVTLSVKYPGTIRYVGNGMTCKIDFDNILNENKDHQLLQCDLKMHRMFTRIVNDLTERIETRKRKYEEVVKVLSEEINMSEIIHTTGATVQVNFD